MQTTNAPVIVNPSVKSNFITSKLSLSFKARVAEADCVADWIFPTLLSCAFLWIHDVKNIKQAQQRIVQFADKFKNCFVIVKVDSSLTKLLVGLPSKVKPIPCLNESQAADFVLATLKGYTKENMEVAEQTVKDLQARSVSNYVVTELLTGTNVIQREEAIQLQETVGSIKNIATSTVEDLSQRTGSVSASTAIFNFFEVDQEVDKTLS